MGDLKQKTLVLFFTIGVSLKKWQKIGMLSREIRPYNFLAKHFKKVYFITYGGKEDLEFKKDLTENVEILPKKIPLLPSVIYAFFIPLIYRKELEEADIYKTNQMAAVPPAILGKCLYGKKFMVRCGYEWLSFLEKRKNFLKRTIVQFLEKIAYKNADIIVLSSARDKKFVENKFETNPAKIGIIPNYVDTDLFKPLNIPKEKNRICFVGGMSCQKNPLNLLKAVDGLDVKLVLFGKEEMGGKVKLMAEKVKKAKIKFRGNILNNQLPEELNKSELFILPSLYEGNPKVLLEAMACGLPCIGTDVEGIKEIIRHKENGYLCQTDSSSIRKAIREVLGDKELQEKMGKQARQTILENFDLGKILEKEIRVYQSL